MKSFPVKFRFFNQRQVCQGMLVITALREKPNARIDCVPSQIFSLYFYRFGCILLRLWQDIHLHTQYSSKFDNTHPIFSLSSRCIVCLRLLKRLIFLHQRLGFSCVFLLIKRFVGIYDRESKFIEKSIRSETTL